LQRARRYATLRAVPAESMREKTKETEQIFAQEVGQAARLDAGTAGVGSSPETVAGGASASTAGSAS